MKTYPNQRVVTIHKSKNGLEKFTTYTQFAQQIAMNEIDTLSGLKLWLYFMKNRPTYTLALSPTDCREWGLSEKSYYAGITILCELGYLEAGEGNTLDFYDIPPRLSGSFTTPVRGGIHPPLGIGLSPQR